LTEGIPPDASGITINQFEAVTEQYGSLVRLSDLAELTARHNLVERTIYMLGLQAAETYDQLIYTVLDAGTTGYRPNNKAADTNLVGSDLVTSVDLIEIEATLNVNGARPFESGYYPFITSPQVYAGVLKDPDFKAAAQFRAPEKIWRGEVGELYGFRVIRTNSPAFASTAQATAGQASLVYSSFALGRFAYQISDLQNLRVYKPNYVH
jgi:N4-gp56 family major capsid protein